jgi:mannitol/fructose-specific phosphotransferase system IIA component
LIDQIVRRVDEKHRSVGMFFREEIAIPHGTVGETGVIVVGIDFFIGLPQSEQWRVARITAVTWADLINEVSQ